MLLPEIGGTVFVFGDGAADVRHATGAPAAVLAKVDAALRTAGLAARAP